MTTFNTFSYMLFQLTSGDYTSGTLTEFSAGGFISTGDAQWNELEVTPDDTFELGEKFSDLNGQAGGTLTYRGYIDSGQGARRLFVFSQDGSNLVYVASIVEYPATFPDGDPGNYPSTINTADLITTDTAFCFIAGTQIATPEGERAVESLKIGDRVLTAEGKAVPVLWLGVQHVALPRLMPQHLEPVLITKGALGGGLPHSDLTVSADHGFLLDGVIVNASALVNGMSVRFAPQSAAFTYYHIETEAHDVILANGAPAETFIDVAGRKAFDNYDEYLALYGADRMFAPQPLPRISAARHLPAAIKARLSADADAPALAQARTA